MMFSKACLNGLASTQNQVSNIVVPLKASTSTNNFSYVSICKHNSTRTELGSWTVLLNLAREKHACTQTSCEFWILLTCFTFVVKLHQGYSSCIKALWNSDLMYIDIFRIASSFWIKSLDNQLASSLLTTCSRLVIIKPEQAMRTHPVIFLMIFKATKCCRGLAATWRFCV